MRVYSILLVDDEELALLGLEKGICWEKLGITRRYCTGSMSEAVDWN